MKFISTFLICLLGLQNGFAQTIPSCVTQPQVYFINGVKNSEKEANYSATMLGQTIETPIPTAKPVEYLYNPHADAGASDFDELKAQIAIQNHINTSEASVLVDMARLGHQTTLNVDQTAAIAAKLTQLYAYTLANLDLSFTFEGKTTTTAQVLADFVARISIKLNTRSKVILVAHSQGNMFANELFLGIKANQTIDVSNQLSVVNVATPASWAPSNLYIRIIQDFVIGIGARFMNGVPLPANTDAVNAKYYDNMTHGFVEVYINSELLGTQNGITKPMADWVVDLIQQAIALAPEPQLPLECRPVAAVCPDTFTQTQIAQIKSGVTVPQVNGILGCPGRTTPMSFWYMWYKDSAILTGTTVQVKFTNGVYLGTLPDDIRVEGQIIP